MGKSSRSRVACVHLTDSERGYGPHVSHPVTGGRRGRKCRRHMRLHAGTL